MVGRTARAWLYESARERLIVATLFLVVAVVFGGGGSPSPLPELAVELAALLGLVAWQFTPRPSVGTYQFDGWFVLTVVAVVAVYAIQLVPLPPSVWQALPGRGTERALLALVGQQDSWRPVTIDINRTVASLLSLIPPLAMMVFVAGLSTPARGRLLLVVVVLTCLAALVGAVQVISGTEDWLHFYPNSQQEAGFATGFNANRNSSADLLLLGLLSLGASVALNRYWLDNLLTRVVIVVVALYLALGVVMTGSRTGVALIPVALGGAMLMIWPNFRIGVRSLAVLGGSLLLLVGVGVTLRDNAALDRTFQRFNVVQEARFSDFWPDAKFAARQYWPVGAGMGTFIPAFKQAERLDVVVKSSPNRAHNDYLELAIETGAGGLILLAILASAALVRAVVLLRGHISPDRRVQICYMLCVSVILGIHSLLDYPLRSISLAVVAGMSLAFLYGRSRDRGGRFVD